jgi:hypothetical protein
MVHRYRKTSVSDTAEAQRNGIGLHQVAHTTAEVYRQVFQAGVSEKIAECIQAFEVFFLIPQFAHRTKSISPERDKKTSDKDYDHRHVGRGRRACLRTERQQGCDKDGD